VNRLRDYRERYGLTQREAVDTIHPSRVDRREFLAGAFPCNYALDLIQLFGVLAQRRQLDRPAPRAVQGRSGRRYPPGRGPRRAAGGGLTNVALTPLYGVKATSSSTRGCPIPRDRVAVIDAVRASTATTRRQVAGGVVKVWTVPVVVPAWLVATMR
jgi:hypothetical protein